MEGWIKLHRKILKWEWIDHPNTFALFIDLLLTVNWEDGNWRGNKIKRGQRITSLSKLAKENGMSMQNVRTALSHLESTGEITNESQANFRLITVNNFNLYQEDNNLPNKLPTNDQQTTNNNIRKKERKNIRNKEDYSESSSLQPPRIKKMINGNDDKGKDTLFDVFLSYCESKGVLPAIRLKQFMELKDEFGPKVIWGTEWKGCVDWLHDNGLQVINLQRLRNRMKNAIKFSKERELKQLQEYQDKKTQIKVFVKPNLGPVWTPPL